MIANPSPAVGDSFGLAMAAVGNDRVIIGAKYDDTNAKDAGAAYLFSTNGTLLTTFTNPTPSSNDLFGISVAAVGNDCVLIGANQNGTGMTNVGAAYLFSANGALLTTFNNPTPAANEFFGSSLAAVGSDRVIIGAPLVSTGAAYLFSTNGALLTTFSNPAGNSFGGSMAAVGSDHVIIGAPYDHLGASYAGASYLFRINGTLITTFTNPTPAYNENFGNSVAAVGSDRVLIGAYRDDTGAMDAGVAYLFSTNGTLLNTFTNPTPAVGDFFGASVAAVGSDRVIIGAHSDDMYAMNAGVAYLFSTNGTLLNTFTNLTPMNNDSLGYSVAAVGSDRVLVSAYRKNAGATDAGAVYLFSLETFTPGLVADGVRANSITTRSLEDGAVTAAKLDSMIGIWTRSGNDVFRSAGNVGIGITTPTNKLHVAGGISATAFVSTSDRNAKEHFMPVLPREVLDKVAALPITRWNFKDLKDGQHIGPMAQDFFTAFGLGGGETTITTVDADGVALAAIQGLNQKVEELRGENAALKRELEQLKQMVDKLANANN